MVLKTFYTTLPEFLEIQKSSFCWFLQLGLISEFQSFSSIIYSTSINLDVYSQEYFLMKPKYSLIETKNKNYTYSVKLYIPILITYTNPEKKNTINYKLNMCFGEIPLMTNYGTFIINGYERLVVNQIIRSPGIYFMKETNISKNSNIYKAQIIPDFGSWLKFELNSKDILTFNIDKSQKINILVFLNLFKFDKIKLTKFFSKKFLKKNFNEMSKFLEKKDFYSEKFIKLSSSEVRRKYIKKEIFNLLIYKYNNKYFKNHFQFNNLFIKNSVKYLEILLSSLINFSELKSVFITKILNSKNYSLGQIGRFHMNNSLDSSFFQQEKSLIFQDIVKIIEKLLKFQTSISEWDDLECIDNLKNKRVRAVGELLQTQIRLSLKKIKTNFLKTKDVSDSSIRIRKLISQLPIITTFKTFFNTSELSQFLDQTNLLAQIAHLRRITSLGPNGFLGQRVSLNARDIHSSFYGRLCPIETPEGQNAGLISTFACYARVNSFGYIETPFFKVKKGIILCNEKPIYLMPHEEKNLKIAPADTLIENNKFITNQILVRYNEKFVWQKSVDINLIEISPLQFLSISTSLVPFLEHDDANRLLMGASMQRQAVPLLYPMKPYITTGLENQIACNSGLSILSLTDGYVINVSSDFIQVEKEKKTILYSLIKYEKSNQETCINQKPIVWIGEQVKIGQILADGPSTEEGELSLGQNLLVAYISWDGYNFEDSILISEHLIDAEFFTSVHIKKISVNIENTRLGSEKMTKNLQNLNINLLAKLDDNGVIKKNSFVKPKDILVGIVKPIQLNEVYSNPYFNRILKPEKTITYINKPFLAPIDCYGRILDVNLSIYETSPFNITLSSIKKSLYKIDVYVAQISKLQIGDKLSGRHGNKGIISKILAKADIPFLPNGQTVDILLNPLGVPSRMNVGQLYEGFLGLASEFLNKRYRIVPFDEMFNPNASRILINSSLNTARKTNGISWLFNNTTPGKVMLRDSRTGENFDNPISICKSYILKLIHLVDEKIQSRSTAKYSVITQQPLGGRSLEGGQRFGEMEVWALEAFGASYTLQEILTYKSDDIITRERLKNSIIQNTKSLVITIPESFKLLLMELRALGIELNLNKFSTNTLQINKIFCISLLSNDFLKFSNLPIYNSIE
jgi:DNA-directed RNA polymerase subunit beta